MRDDRRVSYRERATAVPGAVLWERAVGSAPERTRILPDGCVDMVWDGRRLFVAGPDAAARWPVFGYGPRRLARVLRMGRALDEARTGAPLAQVAAGCGYVDQAHLSREVRALAGRRRWGYCRS
ncbi:MAG: helix-turn-helix domain-containing protein [Pseudonocardiaceae bacterium]